MDIKVKERRKGYSIVRSTEEAGAYDVVAVKIHQDRQYVTVYLGFATEIPKGYRGRIVPRSSIGHKSWVMANSPAIIDSDYRGEWMIKFESIKKLTQGHLFDGPTEVSVEFPWQEGERCAQIYFEEILPVNFIKVVELSESTRGEGGHGSTGK